MSRAMRLLFVVVGAVAAIVLFVVLRDDGDPDEPEVVQPTTSVFSTIRQQPPPSAPQVILIAINTDAIRRATIPRGRRVILVVSGAAGEEVHLHGYDIKRRIGRNRVVRIPFRATIPGRFEVELEASHRQIADLTVR